MADSKLDVVVGRLSGTPELRYVGAEGKKPVCSVNLAVSPGLPLGNEQYPSTVWFRLIAWDDKALALSGLKKDMRVLVAGLIRRKTWKDKNDQDRESQEITLNDLRVIGYNEFDRRFTYTPLEKYTPAGLVPAVPAYAAAGSPPGALPASIVPISAFNLTPEESRLIAEKRAAVGHSNGAAVVNGSENDLPF